MFQARSCRGTPISTTQGKLMNTSLRSARVLRTRQAARLSALTVGAAVALFATGANAATAAKLSEAQQRYQQDRTICLTGGSNQDRATCLQEAGAALQEASRGGSGAASAGELRQNRTIRCDALPAADREDCARRMQGEGVTAGNAQQGGVLRELSRPVASPNATAP
jgi:hypothetical protein